MALSLRVKLTLSACMLIMLMALTGCVVSVNIPKDEKSVVDAVYAQCANGTVVECVYNDSKGTYDSPTIGSNPEAIVVGHFIKNGDINWVPEYTVVDDKTTTPGTNIHNVDIKPTGNSLDMPQEPAESAELLSIEKTGVPFEYKIGYKVFDGHNEPADIYTHVFACFNPPSASDPLLYFKNSDYDNEQVVGDSSCVYDEEGNAEFLVHAEIDTSVVLYTGEKAPSNLLNTEDLKFGALRLPTLTITDADTASDIPIAFKPATFDYTYSIGKSISRVELAIGANDSSRVSLNGVYIGHGSLTQTVDLEVGSNTICIELNSDDPLLSGLANKYKIRLIRGESDLLSSLSIDEAALTPAFDMDTTSYTANVANNVETISIAAVAEDSDSVVSIAGPNGQTGSDINLAIGINTISVTVTTADGEGSEVYTILVTRAASNNAKLSGLTVGNGFLSPAFDPDEDSYTVNVEYSVSGISITPAAAGPGAVVTMTGPNSQTVSPFSLNVGQNIITVTVTAQDGTTTEVYTIRVTRLAPPPSDKDDKGDSGSDTVAPPAANKPDTSAGYTPSINQDPGTGYSSAELGAGTFNSLIGSAPRNAEGMRQLQINIPSVGSSGGTVLTLPKSGLSMGVHNQDIVVNTPIAAVTLPGNMLGQQNDGAAGTVSLTIAQGDASRITNPEVKALIGGRPLVELSLKDGDTRIDWNNPNAPVTVSIPYVPTAAELQASGFITVCYIDGTGKAISVPSGRYDPATGRVTFTVTHFSTYAVVYNRKTFNDLYSHAWARQSIEVMAAKGIVSGTSADAYSPGTPITRAEFLDSLIKALDLSASFKTNFKDMPIDAPCYQSVGTAKALEIALGAGNNYFYPKSLLTRQEMMIFMHRALLKSGKGYQKTGTEILNSFTDKDSLVPYAAESAASLIGSGIVTGSNGRLDPLGNTTRAEAAVLMYRLYNMK